MGIPTDISLTDYLEIRNTAYALTDCYDTKDWVRLKSILGPAIHLDYRALGGALQDGLTPDQMVAFISDKKMIGDPRVKTQHFLGGSSWNAPGDGTVEVWWQLQASHNRYAAEDFIKSVATARGYGDNKHTYKKIDGTWKIIGIDVKKGWVEGDLLGVLHGIDEE